MLSKNTLFISRLLKLKKETKQLTKPIKKTASEAFILQTIALLFCNLENQNDDRLHSIAKLQTTLNLPKSFSTAAYAFFLWNLYGNMAKSIYVRKKHSIKNKALLEGQESLSSDIAVTKFFKNNFRLLKKQKEAQTSLPLLRQVAKPYSEEGSAHDVSRNASVVTLAFLAYQVNNKSIHKMTPAHVLRTAFALQQLTLNIATK